eukprot:Lankesteria_metandrocarpae@DN4423_c0_g1_i2.p1
MSSKFEFAVDFAPSSRGKCKGCKSTITKGDLRMGVKSVLDADRAAEMDSSRRAMIEAHQWYHVKFDCFGTYRKTAKWWTENTPELESIVGIDDVEDDDRDEIDEILNELREGNVPGAKSKAKGKAKSKASPKKNELEKVALQGLQRQIQAVTAKVAALKAEMTILVRKVMMVAQRNLVAVQGDLLKTKGNEPVVGKMQAAVVEKRQPRGRKLMQVQSLTTNANCLMGRPLLTFKNQGFD